MISLSQRDGTYLLVSAYKPHLAPNSPYLGGLDQVTLGLKIVKGSLDLRLSGCWWEPRPVEGMQVPQSVSHHSPPTVHLSVLCSCLPLCEEFLDYK